ncbi:MAG TPA: NYN domain-containing protein [Burkholderiaceae bacterium]|nr:NYN domain-containing protein [Burkholderiaceae bacterium]
MSTVLAGPVMLFIDADNVSGDVIEQAVARVLAEHGAIHVRRAYCTAEVAVSHAKLFKRLAIRPMVNLASGKNSTDIALAVDAIDLVAAQRPALAIIVSSDSDFAPLVIRLREKGCRVLGIGQKGKTGDEAIGVYDAFVDLEHRRAGTTTPAAKVPKAGKTASAAVKAAKATPATAKPAKTPAAKRTKASSAADGGDAPERVLAAIPELRDGRWFELRNAAEALRAAGLLAKNASSTKLFGKYPASFELTPVQQPNKVRWRASPA